MSSILDTINSLPEYRIEIGVVSGSTTRKVMVGITNAELMFIHENGSPLRKIPARPVLGMTIDYANATLLKPTMEKALNAYLTSDGDINKLEAELRKMCIRMQNYARDIIYSNDGRLAPNAPSTIKRKKDNHPLFDTGQLARSITCQLKRI